jgi:hypothetical protein
VSTDYRQRTDETQRRVRFPQQRHVLHPHGYTPGPADRDQVRSGRALFLVGSVLAAIEALCRFCRGSEYLAYYLASLADPFLIDDILIPEQTVSCGSCEVNGQSVLRAGREARARGKRIVGAAHSHGYSSVFSSNTDREQMNKLAGESVGYAQDAMIGLCGTVSRVPQPPTAGHQGRDSHVLRVDFDGLDESMEIETARPDLAPDDLRVIRRRPIRQIVSIFTTSNAEGEHYVPAYKVLTCAHCGHRQEQFVEAQDVVVHIVGPIQMSRRKELALLDVAESRIRMGRWRGWSGSYSTRDRDRDVSAPMAAPAPFEIYRRNRLVSTIPAAVLEEAAAKNDRLAAALGWRLDHENTE